MGIFNWQSSATIVGNNDLAIPGDLGLASFDFFAADRIRLDYKSKLHSAEANIVQTIADDFLLDSLSLVGGFRYVTVLEDFTLRSTDLDTGTSKYRIHTTNNLFGGQLGGRVKQTFDTFGWDATAKAGVFGNASQQTQSVTDFPPPFVLRDSRGDRGGQVAFVFDVSLSGFFRINDTWALRSGYNLLWVQGVSLAPNQLDFTDTPTSGMSLDRSGGFFAHGMNVGVQANW